MAAAVIYKTFFNISSIMPFDNAVYAKYLLSKPI